MWSQDFKFGEPAIEPVLPKKNDEPPEHVKRARELRSNKWYAFALRVAGLSHMHIDTLWNKGYRRGDDERLEQDAFTGAFEETNLSIEQLCEGNSEAQQVYVTENRDYRSTGVKSVQFYIVNKNQETQPLVSAIKENSFTEDLQNANIRNDEYLRNKLGVIDFENTKIKSNRLDLNWQENLPGLNKKSVSKILRAAGAKSTKYTNLTQIIHIILYDGDKRQNDESQYDIYFIKWSEFEKGLKTWETDRNRVWSQVGSVLRDRTYREMVPDKTDWMVFSPELAAHMEEGFVMVTTRWRHLGGCRLEEFIVHPKISVLFAHLVMLLMRNNAFLTQRRYMLQRTYRMTNQRIQKILYMFKFVQRSGRRLKVIRN